MPLLTLNVQLTPDDHVAFMEYYFKRRSEGRRAMRKLRLLGVALFIAFAVMESRSPQRGLSHPQTYTIYMLFSALLLGGGYAILLLWLRQSLARLAVQMGAKRALLLPTDYTFFQDHVEVHTKAGTGRIAWSHVAEVVKDGPRIYILLGGANAFILPRQQPENSPAPALFDTLRTYWQAANPAAGLREGEVDA